MATASLDPSGSLGPRQQLCQLEPHSPRRPGLRAVAEQCLALVLVRQPPGRDQRTLEAAQASVAAIRSRRRPRPVASSSPAAAPQQRTVGRPHDRRQRLPRHRGLALLKGGQPYQRILGRVGVDRRGGPDRNRSSQFDQARSATSQDPGPRT